ncbi:hypothetical protein CONPUDRAFT_154209 [Coniophora puteana RWD-64-598 SS2]|uniref:Uncharacterized protein n=1 Tax=Coniophora puteana (strain RWD-64-598) TaxID=741705 RepID=A0A5M3MMB9_CONPW|nr:uncharacterized protein CONPUDRAFT_154209 [Coniophora puteana RWD-64-598 SS2]EIW80160.1 hypothetical protein CONPUDRAFT_154209 [Coniophora puteana RWD-64-598 SS2]
MPAKFALAALALALGAFALPQAESYTTVTTSPDTSVPQSTYSSEPTGPTSTGSVTVSTGFLSSYSTDTVAPGSSFSSFPGTGTETPTSTLETTVDPTSSAISSSVSIPSSSVSVTSGASSSPGGKSSGSPSPSTTDGGSNGAAGQLIGQHGLMGVSVASLGALLAGTAPPEFPEEGSVDVETTTVVAPPVFPEDEGAVDVDTTTVVAGVVVLAGEVALTPELVGLLALVPPGFVLGLGLSLELPPPLDVEPPPPPLEAEVEGEGEAEPDDVADEEGDGDDEPEDALELAELDGRMVDADIGMVDVMTDGELEGVAVTAEVTSVVALESVWAKPWLYTHEGHGSRWELRRASEISGVSNEPVWGAQAVQVIKRAHGCGHRRALRLPKSHGSRRPNEPELAILGMLSA